MSDPASCGSRDNAQVLAGKFGIYAYDIQIIILAGSLARAHFAHLSSCAARINVTIISARFVCTNGTRCGTIFNSHLIARTQQVQLRCVTVSTPHAQRALNPLHCLVATPPFHNVTFSYSTIYKIVQVSWLMRSWRVGCSPLTRHIRAHQKT